MKLLYVTDTHIRGTPPEHRLDDFPRTLLAKLEEVVELARAHEVQAILHGGDLFDRPDVAPSVARDFLGPLRAAPCPIFGIAGNHDVYGHNPETLVRTMLGLFDGFGLIRLIRPGEVIWLEEPGLRVQLTGQEFHYDIDRRDPVLDYCLLDPDDPSAPEGHRHWRDPGARWAIHMTHGMVLERPFFEGIAYTLLDQIMHRTRADITLCGHYHPGFSQVVAHGGRLFINPGALVRLAVSAAELRRRPAVVLLELTPDRVAHQVIPLRSAPVAEEALETTHLAIQEARSLAMAEFLQGVRAAGDFQELELTKILDKIAGNAGVPPAVKTEALRRIAQAQELLAQGALSEEE